jgi:hypothetical protein
VPPAPVEVLVPVPVEVLVPVPVEVPVPVDVPVPVEVVAPDVVVAAVVDVLLPPPVPPPIWQFGLSLAPAGQQMSELPRSSPFDLQIRPVAQSVLADVGSSGVAETFRSQRWPSP